MPFTKGFFDKFPETYEKYLQTYPCRRVSVAIRSKGQDYFVGMLLGHDEFTVTFSYYDENKQVDLKETDEWPQALPALTLPYELIESVEFIPAVPGAREYKVGFVRNKKSDPEIEPK